MSAAARRAYLSLGSNLGDRAGFLAQACASLAALPGTTVVAVSRVYETAPQGGVEQPAFLNQVVCLETQLAPDVLLAAAQRLEAAAGRVRGVRFGPRTLDIDILLYEAVESADPDLTLPHPRLRERAFVLVPLAELWSWARGMTPLDVEGLARATAMRQQVRPVELAEMDRDEP